MNIKARQRKKQHGVENAKKEQRNFLKYLLNIQVQENNN